MLELSQELLNMSFLRTVFGSNSVGIERIITGFFLIITLLTKYYKYVRDLYEYCLNIWWQKNQILVSQTKSNLVYQAISHDLIMGEHMAVLESVSNTDSTKYNEYKLAPIQYCKPFGQGKITVTVQNLVVEGKGKGETNSVNELVIENYGEMNELKSYIDNCVDAYNTYTKKNTKYAIYTLGRFDHKSEPVFDEVEFQSTKTFDNVFFDEKVKVMEGLDFFIQNRKYYESCGIPYTCGFLFYGLPGCGKTSTIKAIANHTKRSIISINFSKIRTCEQFRKVMYTQYINQQHLPNSKKIIVIEDIDDLNELEKPPNTRNFVDELNDEDPLTLSYVLNIIDGICEMEGRILIITTNNYEGLNKSLIRPGRIDHSIEFKKCTEKVRQEIYEHFSFNEQLNETFQKGTAEGDTKYDDLTPAELIQTILTRKDFGRG